LLTVLREYFPKRAMAIFEKSHFRNFFLPGFPGNPGIRAARVRELFKICATAHQ
jgi:hypothetical protein